MPTIVLLTTAQRIGSVSADFTMPATPNPEAIVHLDLSPADMNDPTTQLTARMPVSRDGGSSWEQRGGGSWIGGASAEKGGATREWRLIIGAAESLANLPARCELELAALTRLSVRVTV